MRDLEWLVPVSIILLIELLLWWLAFAAGLAFPPRVTASGAAVNLIFVVVVFVKFSALMIRMYRQGEPEPLKHLVGRQQVARIVLTVLALQLLVMAASAFAALKAAIPKVVPFWLDVPLAGAEQKILGAYPWQISHAALGWATPAIDAIYATYVPLETAVLVIVLCARPSTWKSTALVTIALAWIVLGVFGAFLFSSAGPIFYDRVFGGDAFAGLTQAIHESAPLTAKVSDVLWKAHALNQEIMLNGISAMPSMHVAGALWIALAARHTRIAPLAWTYYAIIWIGSVHLGWHYLSDGLVGSAGVLGLWHISPRLFFRWKCQSESQRPAVVG